MHFPAPQRARALHKVAAELQRSQELLQHQIETVQTQAVAATSSKRQRLQFGGTADLPFDRDDILDHVFSFVGGGDHLYIGGVCRRWKGRYIQYCAQSSSAEVNKKLVTSHRNVFVTESRLQLALNSGLTVEGRTFDSWSRADLICYHSCEPEKVMTLLRVHGVPWSTDLCNSAAFNNKLALLQWLHAHSCPWQAESVLRNASAGGSIAMLGWLVTVTPPWSSDTKQTMLTIAANYSRLAAVQWLAAQGALRSDSFSHELGYKKLRVCWTVLAVQWALAQGSGWLDWKCEDYAADKYGLINLQQQAVELLEWAHANGCPCTCGHLQQQQQQQQQQ
eukprot:20662-Heterococcus_DN1.PRE.3